VKKSQKLNEPGQGMTEPECSKKTVGTPKNLGAPPSPQRYRG
jgi:hypothetical protein